MSQTIVEWFLLKVPGAKERVQEILGLTPGEGTPVPDASTTVKGIVEMATVAEAEAGMDTARAVTPEGVAAALAAAGLGSPLVLVATADVTSVPGATLSIINTTFAGTLSIANSAAGTYDITSTEAEFPAGLTLWLGGIAQTATGQVATLFYQSTTVIRIITRSNTGTVANQNINGIPIFVLAYPTP